MHILLILLQLALIFFIAILSWRVIKKLNIFLRIISFLLLFSVCLFFSVATYQAISLRVLLLNKQTDPGRFIKNEKLITELTGLSQELISKKNIIGVSSRVEIGDYFAFGITYVDGDYIFVSQDIPADHDFDKPVYATKAKSLLPWPVAFLNDGLKKTQKILSAQDYLFCKQTGSLLRKNGLDKVEYSRQDGIVRFSTGYTRGWDVCEYWYYYFCPNKVFPEKYANEVKNIKKLKENWFFATYECK